MNHNKLPKNICNMTVERQLKAMGCGLYEIGIRHASKGMLNREWTAQEVLKAIPWLKHQNYKGCDIYIRPARNKPNRLILVDDLNRDTIEKMHVLGVVSRNPRFFRHPNFRPATSSSRSISLLLF